MKKEQINFKSSKTIALLGIFSALVIVLQFISYFIKIGTFNLTLVLVPIILGAVMYGPEFGTILGAIFGVMTVIGCITGFDNGGHILFQSSPILTILTCMTKGMAAGYIAGIVSYPIKSKNRYGATLLAAITAPVVNTGIFIVAMFLFFKNTLYVWSGDTNVLYYALYTLIGINFIIEFSLNVVLSHVIYRVIGVLRKNPF